MNSCSERIESCFNSLIVMYNLALWISSPSLHFTKSKTPTACSNTDEFRTKTVAQRSTRPQRLFPFDMLGSTESDTNLNEQEPFAEIQ